MSYEGLPVAQEQVYWVAKSGNDTNSGLSVDDAFLTWDAACAAVSALTPSATNQFVINCEDAGIYAGPSAQVPDYCSINATSCTFTTGIVGGAFSVMNIGIINITSGIGYSVNSSAETSVNIGSIILTSGATGVSAVTAIINGFIGAIYDTDSTGTGILINDSSIISFTTGAISCGTAINQSAGTLNLTCTTLVGTNTFTGGIQSLISAALISGPTLDLSHVENVLTEANGGTNQSTYAKGDILFASAANTLSKLTAAADGTVLTLASGVPSWATGGGLTVSNLNDYYSTPDLAYVSYYQASYNWFNVADQTNSYLIKKTNTSTIALNATGVNGIAQSSNLSGTVTVVSTGTVVGVGTSFTTDFIVGDVIYIAGIPQGRRITAIGSNTSITVSPNWTSSIAGTTYKRGGLAPNMIYYCYAISQAAGANPALMVSTRDYYTSGSVLVDLPSGYTLYRRLIGNMTTDASNNLLYGSWAGNTFSFVDNPILVTPAGSTAGSIGLNGRVNLHYGLMPTNTIAATIFATSTDLGVISVGLTSSVFTLINNTVTSGLYQSSIMTIYGILIYNTPYSFHYQITNTAGTQQIYVNGYTVSMS